MTIIYLTLSFKYSKMQEMYNENSYCKLNVTSLKFVGLQGVNLQNTTISEQGLNTVYSI